MKLLTLTLNNILAISSKEASYNSNLRLLQLVKADVEATTDPNNVNPILTDGNPEEVLDLA